MYDIKIIIQLHKSRVKEDLSNKESLRKDEYSNLTEYHKALSNLPNNNFNKLEAYLNQLDFDGLKNLLATIYIGKKIPGSYNEMLLTVKDRHQNKRSLTSEILSYERLDLLLKTGKQFLDNDEVDFYTVEEELGMEFN